MQPLDIALRKLGRRLLLQQWVAYVAKGLTGGYMPMAATLTTDEIWRAFLGKYVESKSFFHGHTYGGNPLGAAVALATLDVFDQEHTLERLPRKAARIDDAFQRSAGSTSSGSSWKNGFRASRFGAASRSVLPSSSAARRSVRSGSSGPQLTTFARFQVRKVSVSFPSRISCLNFVLNSMRHGHRATRTQGQASGSTRSSARLDSP